MKFSLRLTLLWNICLTENLIREILLSISGHSRSLFPNFRLFNTVDSKYKCRWLDLNCRSLVSEVTTLPTAQQPVWPDWAIFESSWRQNSSKISSNDLQLFGLFWKTSLLCKNCFSYFLGNVWKNLGYFLLQFLATLTTATTQVSYILSITFCCILWKMNWQERRIFCVFRFDSSCENIFHHFCWQVCDQYSSNDATIQQQQYNSNDTTIQQQQQYNSNDTTIQHQQYNSNDTTIQQQQQYNSNDTTIQHQQYNSNDTTIQQQQQYNSNDTTIQQQQQYNSNDTTIQQQQYSISRA